MKSLSKLYYVRKAILYRRRADRKSESNSAGISEASERCSSVGGIIIFILRLRALLLAANNSFLARAKAVHHGDPELP